MGYIKYIYKLITGILFFNLIICSVSALDNWVYYRKITITNNAAQNLTDYQINFTLNTNELITEGKMRYDCDDIRITADDKLTLLSYWIEPNTCNTNTTKIWVKIPLIPANSSITVLIWYGNPQAVSAANGDNVFLLFDDFNNLNTSKWIFDSPKVSVNNGILNIRRATGCDIIFISQKNFTYIKNTVGISVMWKSRYYNEYGNSGFDLFIPIQNVNADDCAGTTGNYYLFANFVNKLYKHSDTVWTNVYTGSGADTTEIWHIYHAIYDQNFNVILKQDDKTLASYSETTWTVLSGYIAYREGNHDIDWLAVRLYISPEPTVNIGNEQKIQTLKNILPYLAAFIFIFLLLIGAVIIRKNIFILISMLVIMVFTARLQITEFTDYMLAVFALLVFGIMGFLFYGRWRE
jgi:hypothetical protein